MIQQTDFGFNVECVERVPETVLERMLRLSEERGPLVPQAVVPELLGVSRSRVSELLAMGRLESFDLGGTKFLVLEEVHAFGMAPKSKGGRGKKAATA